MMLTRFAIAVLASGIAMPALAQRDSLYPAGSIFLTPPTPTVTSGPTPDTNTARPPVARAPRDTSPADAQDGSSRDPAMVDNSALTAPAIESMRAQPKQR